MERITVSSNSYYDLVKDCIRLCNAIVSGNISDEMKSLALQRLSLLHITANMMLTLSLPEEREFWEKLDQLLEG